MKKVMKKFDETGRAQAKKQTSMTSEQWKELQVGMKEKWPQPDYMQHSHPDGKGHTCYRDETFEIVTRWKAETKISYRPHAKAPGTKSHVRYEKYMKAKTVGEALKLGSWPADWCWDYERGYIKISGSVRDEPIDVTATSDDSKFTDVDKAVYHWYRKELARNLGLSIADLVNGRSSGESTIMRAHRLVAQREAKRILAEAAKKKRKVTDEEVSSVLREWGFAKNMNRVNVMHKGQTWVWSDNLGLVRDRIGDIHITPPAKAYPEFPQLLTKWLTDRLPAEAKHFKFTSLNVNKDYAAKIHRDGNNLGPSMISAFGEFTGGSLCYYPEDDGSEKNVEKLKADKVKFDLNKSLALFNGNCAHSVEDFKGNRFSVVFFTIGCHARMKQEDRELMTCWGMPVPAIDEDPHTSIRPPLGRKGTASKPAANSSLPPFRCWSKSKISSGAPAKKSVALPAKKVSKQALEDSQPAATTKPMKANGVRKTISKPMKASQTMPKNAGKAISDAAVIRRTDKEVKSDYIAARLKKINSKSVEKALGLTFKTASGAERVYGRADLRYDINSGYIALGGA